MLMYAFLVIIVAFFLLLIWCFGFKFRFAIGLLAALGLWFCAQWLSHPIFNWHHLRTPLPAINTSASSEAVRKDHEQYIKQDTIVIATPANAYPWYFVDAKGRPQGFLISVAERAVELMGKQYKVVVFKHQDKMYDALSKRQVDIIADFPKISTQSNSFTTHSNVIAEPPFVFLVKDKLFQELSLIKSHSEQLKLLRKYKIAVFSEDYFTHFAPELVEYKAKVTKFPSLDKVYYAVAKGRYDVGFGDYFALTRLHELYPKDQVDILPYFMHEKDHGVQYTLNEQQLELRTQFNNSIAVLKRRGELTNFSLKYFSTDITI